MNYGKMWFAITVILLLTGVTLMPPITADTKSSSYEKQYVEVEKIFNELKIKLDTVTTKQEALVVVNVAIVGLNEHGLLPKGMTLKRAQRLVTGCFSESDLAQPFQSNKENNTGNTNCLVIGFADQTFFRPYPTIYDIPIVYYLMFNTSFGDYFNFLLWFYAIRASQPFKFGPYAWVGSRYTLVENGNMTYDSIHASSGWVWTLSSNGVKKWNGTFYGGLRTRYQKVVITNDSYAESWDPEGIRGFVGINFFSFRTFWKGNDVPTFYIGYARDVNFTYSPPWT
jgi:hypothetical protein